MRNEIKTMSIDQIGVIMRDLKQPKFRAKQLYEWIHVHHCSSYDEMTNLPKALREELEANYPLYSPHIAQQQESSDGTRKYLTTLSDGNCVETVGIPAYSLEGELQRLTVCFSTQVGCPMACDFCATGKEGFTRSLLADEMVDQIITVQNDFGHRVTNVVAMGQGEPFLNYDELIKVLRILNDPQGMKIGARHITVSTCGIIDGIRKFAEEPEQFTLAISLHSAIQEKRDDLMPKVANQPLDKLKDALKEYVKKTGRRITLEYVLIKGVNDQTEDLGQLASFCKDLLCHVNLLPMNKVEGLPYKPSPKATAAFWKESLEKRHIETTLRISRGKDIKGACGQLKSTQ